ncbi:MAG: c-type cytochrome [Xanthobacteraceae bacterium]
MFRIIPGLLAGTAFALTTGMSAVAEPGPSAEERGEALLRKNCARCHAVGRTGASPHPEAPPFRSLSDRYEVDGLAESLAEGISVGHPDMPEFIFEADEVGAIIAYLRSIQEPGNQ